MRPFILLIVAMVTLLASYPSVFSRLGDKLYNKHDAIETFAQLHISSLYKQRIKLYLVDLNKTMQMGFAIEKKDANAIAPSEYLQKLRKLSKENDYIIRIAQRALQRSIDEENSTLFAEIIETGLIDLNKEYKSVFPYYESHKEDINSTTLNSWMKEMIQSKSGAKPKAKKSYDPYAESSKAKRLREKQRKKEEEMNAKINSEIKADKDALNQEQIKSLKKE